MANKFEISIFFPCKESIEFREQFPDFKSAWENCPRGDWMLWIAQKLKIDFLKLTTAKALCANTVRHLMKDERSIKAVDTAILFGQGKVTIEELNAANNAARVAACAAADTYSDTYSAYAAAYATDLNTNGAASNVAAYASAANTDASASADASAAGDAAITKNQLQTANICQEILTEVVFEAIDKLTV